jgi:hypothetical protein
MMCTRVNLYRKENSTSGHRGTKKLKICRKEHQLSKGKLKEETLAASPAKEILVLV